MKTAARTMPYFRGALSNRLLEAMIDCNGPRTAVQLFGYCPDGTYLSDVNKELSLMVSDGVVVLRSAPDGLGYTVRKCVDCGAAPLAPGNYVSYEHDNHGAFETTCLDCVAEWCRKQSDSSSPSSTFSAPSSSPAVEQLRQALQRPTFIAGLLVFGGLVCGMGVLIAGLIVEIAHLNGWW